MSTHAPPHVIEDCRGILQFLSDGTVKRSVNHPFLSVPTLTDPSVAVKDFVYDQTLNLSLRIFKPSSSSSSKLPILVFFHGGGYCIGTYAWPPTHNALLRLASDLRSIVVAPDYRLAPESRLPAAVHDGESALNWLLSRPDPFINSIADFDTVFVSGESAGGNLTHHMALKFGGKLIKGYILLQPFFGGVERTPSELNVHQGAFLTLEQSDTYWRLALPVGSDRDDSLLSPFGPRAPNLEEAELGNVIVINGGKDLLRDRGREYGRRLKEMGKDVVVVEIDGAEHAFYSMAPRSAMGDELVEVYKRFMDRNRGD